MVTMTSQVSHECENGGLRLKCSQAQRRAGVLAGCSPDCVSRANQAQDVDDSCVAQGRDKHSNLEDGAEDQCPCSASSRALTC